MSELARLRDAKLGEPAKRSGAPLAVDIRANREELSAGRGDPQGKSCDLLVVMKMIAPIGLQGGDKNFSKSDHQWT